MGLARWAGSCRPAARSSEDRDQSCLLAPLPAGATRDVAVVVPDPGRVEVGVDVEAEGKDLAAGDESAYRGFHHVRPPVTLEADPWPSISRGPLYVTVRSQHAGTVRVRLATGRRTWIARSVRFAHGGSRRVALRRADSTLSARWGTATFKVAVHPSY